MVGNPIGRIYLPKDWVGCLVSVIKLNKKDTKFWEKKQELYKRSIHEREKKYKEHIQFIKELRKKRK